MKDMGVENKVAIVTGASSGIGKATALKLASEKAKVVLVSRSEKSLKEIADQITTNGGTAAYFAADLLEESQPEKVVQFVLDTYGGIDILVNSAGIIRNGSIENTTLAEWDEMMNINLRSVFILTQQALPHLIERKGNIVNVSSVTGLRSFPNILSYCVSKAGVDQFTRCTALELGPKGVRVNAVNPGVTITELHRRGGMDEENYQNFLEHSKDTHPIGRVGRPEEVADLIVFLASPRAGWITGVTYSIDGGRAQTCAR
ncbi:glucose 1-dehydrogenase [candidate division KSB1 bacterium]|nr:glucose 1-dehydrogenase [candidate division KSB1 bacterium]